MSGVATTKFIDGKWYAEFEDENGVHRATAKTEVKAIYLVLRQKCRFAADERRRLKAFLAGKTHT